ncbi:interleukin-2 receptor subunit beta isoform X1 [Onychostoma macrolepis]|uniref:interleukin-2 receptor subunit beta isoform X1 n=2 Tax=Onychostoma macrolepis TaxID=369639 RepID=UPI00272AEB83|nr:interleukin-2 receptor subunit beta isoform X1 [Onychostoma macrolepis]XP_058634550.1 interleukin-2 receptor subunit beta isoform X1 [Onychostoma macrolepis]XP_058634551.1 interleukin-2 receptor subunit beta isoform X1 [Onychostoma macrolepis]XP_058634552.1 interleukin-2 receptor subunit beta isoform X1 [Onychostoma macrolepis]XP_058634553.1 interleukin-2 receptor subunit beta isoform X1 [Onychostoma macrolepis]XP_058634554.1 interleukin-2 receptor subunit beta isoform X1 [Onychostoma macro
MQILALMMVMMMMMMTLSYSALADQSLTCHNDFYNTFTCVWDTSKLDVIPPVQPETMCWIHVTVEKIRTYYSKARMFADPAQPHIRSATVVFDNKRGIIISKIKLHEEVQCENYTNPVAEIAQHTSEVSAVTVAPPQKVEVHGINVSWSFVSSRPFLKPEFGVQFRSAAQSWKDVENVIVNTKETQLELPEDHLVLNQQYVIRVRGKYEESKLPNALWSDWSEEYSWTSAVGQTPPTSEILQLETTVTGITLTGITLTTILIFTILIKCKRIKRNVTSSPFRVQKNGSTYIPDPSKFFGDLNSSHGGNFTSWLGSVLAHESFIRVDTEFISPVEVLKLQDTCESRSSHRNSGGPQDGWDSTAKSSNFSNSTYFMSQSSKGPSDALEPCSAHSSYGPAGGVGDVAHTAGEKEELEFCLEKLRQDTQSPDSGFAGGAEDSMEETELPSPLGLNLAPLLPQNLPAPQPSRHPLMGLMRPSCPIPALDLDLLNLDLQSSCGLIEPSSGDYMPVKNVQS